MLPLRIGPLAIDPPILSAPLAGYSGYAYRQMLRRLGGVGLIAAEMVSARAFVFGERRSGELPERLWGVKDEPRPLAVQIWDNDPAKMAEVGRRLVFEFGASAVDINFGCPVRDVAEKAESGSYLLRFPERIGAIVARVASACAPAPVTAKIRLGCTRESINAVDVAQAVEAAGGAAVTVHGRTAEDLFRGTADWEQIARIKPHLKQIPLIGNGDLKTPQEVVHAFERYGVDGVMIGRAGLARPWLFRQAQAAIRGESLPPDPSPEEQCDLIREQFRLVVEQHGPEKACILIRAMAAPYARGRPGARNFRTHLAKVSTPEDFYALLECDYPR
ncbi:MAG: tRNA-dihydrouridine synthase [Pirellulales bacterium]|nr:tRNA-dihydrouridine synthase [Pirellulales bacterium]